MQLRGERTTQERDQLVELERRGETGRAPVSSAPLRPCDHRHVHIVVGGAQRDFALALALAASQLAYERRELRALQRPQVVDDALRVALLGVGLMKVLGAQPGTAVR